MLILGYDPSNQTSYIVEGGRSGEPKPLTGYSPLRTALVNASKSGTIEEKVKFEVDYDDPENERIDIDETVIDVQSMKTFLQQKGVIQNFFFSDGNVLEEYLDPQNPCFAPKLAAAINAWIEVTHNKDSTKGKTPKQALEKWLRENANQYGLTKEDGSLNETGIQEISKISNWKPEGGATKTPTLGIVQENPPTLQKSRELKVFGIKPEKSVDWGDDIPF